jgi:hypothetical protein
VPRISYGDAELAFPSGGGYAEHMSSLTPAVEITVSYDAPPLVEVTLDGTDFRIDPGKQGTAVSISTRPTGTWDWSFGGEARWDGSQLRCRAFERRVLLELSSAFANAVRELE